MLGNFLLSYCEFRPPAELATHVACTWCNLSRAVVGAPAQAIIPDGCADIIVFGDEAPHIAAPARTTQWVNPPPVGTLISGIRFRPGAVRRILGCDAIELRAWSVELEAVCGRRSWPLLAELRAAGRSDARRRAALAGWARHQLDQNTEADHLVLRAGAMLTRAPGSNLTAVAEGLDISTRHLHRSVSAACGYGPKTLQRIMRLQTSLRLTATQRPAPGLAHLASAAGYADQSHMTREFLDITGLTPGRYLSGFDPEVGSWLGTLRH
ncbi:helix-turn-helix domain-containing protein [Rhizobium leguminosarum]|jgi:AraC-like DNA-binding protein|uniref:helix-turn-helix domain-containing protein n=1 Tax=Rhizobium ruizarguesonis TaxID=2081791 RepID=UPI00103CC8ED|nr:helix-turn-helix domain-containing protein [Rhizobium ruizarguesonis]NEI05278.1 helix-turn-helix domain-containing protein [Rhizobium ruizarguesonis]TCA30109.1 helix-turn-helix domain-containing protein [Rhizobium leguminosarum bv. viciae]